MCYSAQVWADFRQYSREFGATLSIKDFYDLFRRRYNGEKLRIPKAMAAPFKEPRTPEEREVTELIEGYEAKERMRLEQLLFTQRARLVKAERKLAEKPTEAAREDARIAKDKIEKALLDLDDLGRMQLKDRDSRIFPQSYAPIMVVENGKRVIKPMRYLCRPAGKPPIIDKKLPGCYNARRDSLGGYWKDLFGFSHGVLVVSTFYENVKRHRMEGRELREGEEEENVVLRFNPNPQHDMLIACIWSHWKGADGDELLSFAALTDEPPPEVAAAGHDRIIIQIREENLDAWLEPRSLNTDELQRILDDRPRPYYEHRMAA